MLSIDTLSVKRGERGDDVTTDAPNGGRWFNDSDTDGWWEWRGGSEFPGKAPLRRESHLVIHWSTPHHDFRHLIIEENPPVNSMGNVPHQSWYFFLSRTPLIWTVQIVSPGLRSSGVSNFLDGVWDLNRPYITEESNNTRFIAESHDENGR